jgi:hypothetical protein
VKRKDESNSAYKDVLAQVTFLGQFKPDAVVFIGQLPVLAQEMMVHIPVLIVHAPQKKMSGFEVSMLKFRHIGGFES